MAKDDKFLVEFVDASWKLNIKEGDIIAADRIKLISNTRYLLRSEIGDKIILSSLETNEQVLKGARQ